MLRTLIHEWNTDKRWRWSVIGYAILAFAISVGLWRAQVLIAETHRTADQAKLAATQAQVAASQANLAICNQRDAAERNWKQTQRYIDGPENVNGKVFGIPVKVLERSVRLNKQLSANLSDADCSG